LVRIRNRRRPIARTAGHSWRGIPPPTLGEHDMPVLRDILGLSQTEIDKLAAAGIIGTRAVPSNLRKARAAVG